jgi:D-sedoheptulose 7-phosphate isomerase
MIKERISASVALKQNILNCEALLQTIGELAAAVTRVFRLRGKVLFCGNGGSAADAQHLAAELSGRFYLNRPPLYADALHCNTSYLTAVANDFSFEDIYARLVAAMGARGDMLVALSTSGNSANVLKAIEAARTNGMLVAGFTGESGGGMRSACDYLINVPSTDTPRIQEAHMLIGHIICEQVEKDIFG